MSLTVGTNSTMFAMLQNIYTLESDRATTMTQLATGKRINKASDDPAGLIALSAMNGDMSRLNTAIANQERSQAVLDTADATLQSINDLVKEIETAAINASDPNATSAELASYQATVDQSLDTIDSLMATASFNGTKLFTGTAGITPTVTDANSIIADEHMFSRDATAVADTTITVATDATGVLTVAVGGVTQSFGAVANGDEIHYSIGGYTGMFTMDTVTNNKTASIKVAATGGQTFQLGTDASTQTALDLGAGIRSTKLGTDSVGYLSTLRSGQGADLSTDAATAATIATKASQQVATQLSRIGNFSKHTIGASMKALEAQRAATANTISSIRDTDYAKATADLDRQNILMSAAVSMLAMSNDSQMNIMSLLR